MGSESVDAPEGVAKRCIQVALCRVSGIRLRERSADESLADENCSSYTLLLAEYNNNMAVNINGHKEVII